MLSFEIVFCFSFIRQFQYKVIDQKLLLGAEKYEWNHFSYLNEMRICPSFGLESRIHFSVETLLPSVAYTIKLQTTSELENNWSCKGYEGCDDFI